MTIIPKIIFSVSFSLIPQFSYAYISSASLRKLFIVTESNPNTINSPYSGVVLFKNHFQKYKTACDYKKQNPDSIIFIDQEGGQVIRIPDAAPPSALDARKLNNIELYNSVKESAKKLKKACIDVNLAPVVEVSDDPMRSYGTIPEEVIPKAKVFSEAMQSENIKTVLKHFPGWNEHCTAVTDLSTINLSVRKNTEAQKCSVRESEKYIFLQKAKVFNKVPSNAWMVSNNIINELGPYPSNMNPLIHQLIRKNLSYNGVLISDALWEIEASPKAIIMALQVVDLVMVATGQQVEEAIPLVHMAINKNILNKNDILLKLTRIEEFKKSIVMN